MRIQNIQILLIYKVMLLMNGYLRKAQHDENNLNIEVTVEVILEIKAKKPSVFNGFKRQTAKSTV